MTVVSPHLPQDATTHGPMGPAELPETCVRQLCCRSLGALHQRRMLERRSSRFVFALQCQSPLPCPPWTTLDDVRSTLTEMIVVSTSSRLVEARIYHFSAKGAKVYARVDACLASMRARETNASLRAVRACVRANSPSKGMRAIAFPPPIKYLRVERSSPSARPVFREAPLPS